MHNQRTGLPWRRVIPLGVILLGVAHLPLSHTPESRPRIFPPPVLLPPPPAEHPERAVSPAPGPATPAPVSTGAVAREWEGHCADPRPQLPGWRVTPFYAERCLGLQASLRF